MFLKIHSLPLIWSLIRRPLTGWTPQLFGNKSKEKSTDAYGSSFPKLYRDIPQMSKSPTSFSFTEREIFIGVGERLWSLNLTDLGSSNFKSCSSGEAITSKSISKRGPPGFYCDPPSPADLKGPIFRRPGSPK